MQVLQHLRPRLMLFSRITMWAIVSLFLGLGLFSQSDAWAVVGAHPECGPQTIPPAHQTLYIKQKNPHTKHGLKHCKNEDAVSVAGVDAVGDLVVTPSFSRPGLIALNPPSITFTEDSPESIDIDMALAPNHNLDTPFSVVVTYTAQSEDPNASFNIDPVNVTAYYSPPVAAPDRVMVRIGTTVAIPVLANDTDRLGQAGLTSAVVTNPARGSAVHNANHTIQYTAPTGRPGSDPFTYQISDAIENIDTARVLVIVVPANVPNPQTLDIDAEEGGSLTYPTSGGSIEVEVPNFPGVSPDSEVVCVFGESATTSGNLNSRPVKPSSFTGIAFYVQCFVDGVQIEEDELSVPISVIIPLSPSFLAQYGATKLSVANWDDTAWHADGVNILPGTNPGALTINTTRLGEFALFSQSLLYLPQVDTEVE